MVSFSKYHHFSSQYFPQNWSIPDSIIYCITKNPSNAKAWQKLIQSCKYFFAKNNILVINKLYLLYNEKWRIVLNKTENKTPFLYEFQEPANFTNVLCKFWLTDEFDMCLCRKPSIPFSTIFPYLHQVDAKTIDIYRHNFFWHEFLFISSNVEKIVLNYVVVKNEDGTIVPLEKLVKVLPKIKDIHFANHHSSSCITTNTVKELLEIPHIRTIDKFELFNITEKFHIETFFAYLKKNKHTKFQLFFPETISKGYKNRLKKFVDEIIATPSHDYKIPFLFYHGISESKRRKMYSLFRQL